MKSLWFKEHYRRAILAGEKNETFRMHCSLHAGDCVACSVGAAASFATVEITDVRRVELAQLPPAKVAELRTLYGDRLTGFCMRIKFRLLHLDARTTGDTAILGETLDVKAKAFERCRTL